MRKLFHLAFLALVLASCATNEIRHSEKVVRRHDTNNSPWIVFYYDIVGKDSTCVGEKWFHDNGVLNLEGPIVNGKREGRGVVYHENGGVSIEGDYKEGSPVGLWTFYNEEGEIIDIQEYE